jgi:hypothetical protein
MKPRDGDYIVRVNGEVVSARRDLERKGISSIEEVRPRFPTQPITDHFEKLVGHGGDDEARDGRDSKSMIARNVLVSDVSKKVYRSSVNDVVVLGKESYETATVTDYYPDIKLPFGNPTNIAPAEKGFLVFGIKGVDLAKLELLGQISEPRISVESLEVSEPSFDQVTKKLLEKNGADWVFNSNLIGINTTSKDVKKYSVEDNRDFTGTLALLGGMEDVRRGASADQWLVVRIPKSLLFILTADSV